MRQRDCKPGDSQSEKLEDEKIKYMYRTLADEIFICVVDNIDEAIKKRDDWLRKIEAFDELEMVHRG